MINAKELRVGNILSLDKGDSGKYLARVICIDEYNFQVEGDAVHQTPSDSVEPITLTPEILEACGFIGGSLEIDDMQIQVRSNSEVGLFGYDSCTDGMAFWIQQVKYLHQLQNLYFALSGKELEVKLPAFA